MNVNIESADVIRLILQYLKENDLVSSFHAVQNETQVQLNTVEAKDLFLKDVTEGHWENVLHQTNTLNLPEELCMKLYEHIALECMEAAEVDTARELLRCSEAMKLMKSKFPERYMRLERFLIRSTIEFDAHEAYCGVNKENKREELAIELDSEVQTAVPSRLLTFIGQALKFQQIQGILPSDTSQDIFNPASKGKRIDHEDRPPQREVGRIKFGKRSLPLCAKFTFDGHGIISGTMDGIIEFWDFESCKIRKDLLYQAKEEFMMHDDNVTSLATSKDGEILASGNNKGAIKIWKLSSGKCLKRLAAAHSKSIKSIEFSRDSCQILSASFDSLIRLHGLKSGKLLKEFRGHSSYVNSATFSSDSSKVISCSADGTIKIWDSRTTECLRSFEPPNARPGMELDVLSVALVPGFSDHILACTRSSTIHIFTLQGCVIKEFESSSDFICAVTSTRGKYIYAVTEKGQLYVHPISGNIGNSAHYIDQVSQDEVFGISVHPYQNAIAVYGKDGYIRLWRP